jgi:molybdopterin molybdotransferase
MLIARPYLHRLQSRTDSGTAYFPVRAGFDYRCGYRREYVRARLHQEPGHALTAEIYPKQGSDVLSSVAWADGLVEIAAESEVRAGDPVRFLPFPEWVT